MEQESITLAKSLPDEYINTWKATLLAIIKLIEAVAAGYALYYIIANPHAVQGIVESFFNGMAFSADAQSSFYSIYLILYNSVQIVLAFELALLVLDGLGSFFTRVAHKGSSVVKLVHIIRYVFSIIGFIGCFYVIIRYTTAMINAAQATNKLGFGDVFTYMGSYELVLYIVFILGAFWILMSYDRYVARVMKQVSMEIIAGEIQQMKKKNRLGRESAWLAGILGISAVLSIVELVAGESVLASIASFVKPVQILYRGSNVISITVVAVMVLKFFLVNRCSADFDRAH